jgi:glycosyltransferase involved in cell wall biosynthesis
MATRDLDVSVALCTYQGASFVLAQLASIAGQTLLPVEVVVCDDRSTDGTDDVVRRFATSAPFPVRLSVNDERLGVTANFAQAITRCSGSVIALADQDDVWMPQKLEQQVEVLRRNPAAGAVFSDAELVDWSLRPLGRSMFEATHFSSRRQRRFRNGHALDVLLARSVVCGATLAFRSSFRDLLLPIPTTGLHDVWLATLLATVTEIVALPDQLVRYRQHGANQVGAPATGPRAKLARRGRQGEPGDEAGHHRAMVERMAAPPRALPVDQLRRKVAHLEFRYGLPAHRTFPVLNELARGRYHRYSRGLESAAYDLFFRASGACDAPGERPARRPHRSGFPVPSRGPSARGG